MDDSGQRHLARRVLIAVGAMLGASAMFVGAVMLLLSFIVERVVTGPESLPATDKTTEVSPVAPGAAKRPAAPSTPELGDRS